VATATSSPAGEPETFGASGKMFVDIEQGRLSLVRNWMPDSQVTEIEIASANAECRIFWLNCEFGRKVTNDHDIELGACIHRCAWPVCPDACHSRVVSVSRLAGEARAFYPSFPSDEARSL
jgi:hypothetical protein